VVLLLLRQQSFHATTHGEIARAWVPHSWGAHVDSFTAVSPMFFESQRWYLPEERRESNRGVAVEELRKPMDGSCWVRQTQVNRTLLGTSPEGCESSGRRGFKRQWQRILPGPFGRSLSKAANDRSSERNQKLLTLSLRCSRRHESHAVRKHGNGEAGNPQGISAAMCIKNEGG
jgi:hypothetical protein